MHRITQRNENHVCITFAINSKKPDAGKPPPVPADGDGNRRRGREGDGQTARVLPLPVFGRTPVAGHRGAQLRVGAGQSQPPPTLGGGRQHAGRASRNSPDRPRRWGKGSPPTQPCRGGDQSRGYGEGDGECVRPVLGKRERAFPATHQGRDRRHRFRLRTCGGTCPESGVRRGGDTLRPRLPAEPVLFPRPQPPDRRLRGRRIGKDTDTSGNHRGHPRQGGKRLPAVPAARSLRLYARRNHPARQHTGGARTGEGRAGRAGRFRRPVRVPRAGAGTFGRLLRRHHPSPEAAHLHPRRPDRRHPAARNGGRLPARRRGRPDRNRPPHLPQPLVAEGRDGTVLPGNGKQRLTNHYP